MSERGIRKDGTQCRCSSCDIYIRKTYEWFDKEGKDLYCLNCYTELRVDEQ